jgi:hypothetical protein
VAAALDDVPTGVADPFRRGPAAAAEAAEHLDDLLGRVLQRLTAEPR